jgi:hypothetical protein
MLIAVTGFGTFTGISMRYPRSRMWTAPLAVIWTTFWTLQAARAAGMTDRIHLLLVGIAATVVAAVFALTIPYTIEDRRKKQAGHDT